MPDAGQSKTVLWCNRSSDAFGRNCQRQSNSRVGRHLGNRTMPHDIANVGQIRLERRSPFYWRVTFDLPPLNIFGPKNIPQLNEIIVSLETDDQVKVVVFDSAVEGLVPGGGPMARLPGLMGRGRALEVLLGADDIPGDLAELYGYVNRALPDGELDSFVEHLALRIASFDKMAIAETKRLVDIASLPTDAEIVPEWDAFIASVARPASQTRLKALMERGFHSPGDVEARLGYYVGQLGATLDQDTL